MDKFREYWNKPAHIAYLFIAPAMILLLLFNIIPLIASLVISTFDVSMTLNDARFVGLGNFVEAFHDSRFWNSMWVTIKWTLVEMPIQVLVALLLAALLTKNTWFNKLCRGVYFLPIICSATAVSIMWRIILNSNVGYITFLLNKLGFGKINFMNNPGVTFYVIVFMSVNHLESRRLFWFLPCKMCQGYFMKQLNWIVPEKSDSFSALRYRE